MNLITLHLSLFSFWREGQGSRSWDRAHCLALNTSGFSGRITHQNFLKVQGHQILIPKDKTGKVGHINTLSLLVEMFNYWYKSGREILDSFSVTVQQHNKLYLEWQNSCINNWFIESRAFVAFMKMLEDCCIKVNLKSVWAMDTFCNKAGKWYRWYKSARIFLLP